MYSTRLATEIAKKIFRLYFKRYRKKRLDPIKDEIHSAIRKYDTFEWNYDRIQAYKVEEDEKVRRNEEKRKNIIEASFALDFH